MELVEKKKLFGYQKNKERFIKLTFSNNTDYENAKLIFNKSITD